MAIYQDQYFQQLDDECQKIFEHKDETKVEQRKQMRRKRKQELLGRKIAISSSSNEYNCVNFSIQQQQQQQQQEKKIIKREPELPNLRDLYIIEIKKTLDQYHWMEPTNGQFCHIDRALAHLHYANGDYRLVQSIITQMVNNISKEIETEIELLWDNSSYHIVSERNPSLNLNSVNMYRIRKKHCCPTMKRSGEKKYRISKVAIEQLNGQFTNNPRPTKLIKQNLANQTGLKIEVIGNWFKNKRQRSKRGSQSISQASSNSSSSSSTSSLSGSDFKESPQTVANVTSTTTTTIPPNYIEETCQGQANYHCVDNWWWNYNAFPEQSGYYHQQPTESCTQQLHQQADTSKNEFIPSTSPPISFTEGIIAETDFYFADFEGYHDYYLK